MFYFLSFIIVLLIGQIMRQQVTIIEKECKIKSLEKMIEILKQKESTNTWMM